MLQVPTIEEHLELKAEIALLKSQMAQLITARNMGEWVGVEVAEKMLSCSRTTIWRLSKDNKLSVEKTGKKVRIGVGSIRNYLESCRYHPAAIQARIDQFYNI